MRHKYATEAIVLSRTPQSEANLLITLVTKELGLVRARAQGVRKPAAKLAAALQTFAGSDVVLVRGKEGWRVSGAILAYDYFAPLTFSMRACAGRVAGLMLRLASNDSNEPELYELFEELLRVLPSLSSQEEEDAEVLAALSLLSLLGLDAGGEVPKEGGRYGALAREYAQKHRKDLIARINRGIQASGL
ncbi:MAG TPA: DNA repair protein RecO [Candidatus Paceibacterota bacterium]|nr:DNA repair protein RecO [Candidatus Paceibacterota bacterium]